MPVNSQALPAEQVSAKSSPTSSLPDAVLSSTSRSAALSAGRPDLVGPVVVVGPSARFLSGVSYYGARLARAFEDHHPAGGGALLLRRLCPEIIYPGRERIGAHSNDVLGLGSLPTFDGVDWFWGRSLPRALRWLHRTRPSVLVLQWWTGTAAHTYLALAAAARTQGALVVIEFHETIDVGEAKIPGVRRYAGTVMAAICRLASATVVHSRADIDPVCEAFPAVRRLPLAVVHHGPFDHLRVTPTHAPEGAPVRFVFFGVMRAYKGLDVLAAAFTQLMAEGVDAHLTVAGEPWPDAEDALAALRAIPKDRVTLNLGHLPDAELTSVVAGADVVVLPYLRSSASGPLHIVMAAGLPVVTTDVPALAEVTNGYSGAVLAHPGDPRSLAAAMKQAIPLIGGNHPDPHSWDSNVARYQDLFDRAAQHRWNRARFRRSRRFGWLGRC
jgi:glycosyltransferase involved in cell wall biosynthesis